jgi:hypothetical protein
MTSGLVGFDVVQPVLAGDGFGDIGVIDDAQLDKNFAQAFVIRLRNFHCVFYLLIGDESPVLQNFTDLASLSSHVYLGPLRAKAGS